MTEKRLNPDLLTSGEDRERAQTLHPQVFFALDHSELQKAVADADEIANNAKTTSRRAGLIAVASGPISRPLGLGA